jgi:hypothetical protein
MPDDVRDQTMADLRRALPSAGEVEAMLGLRQPPVAAPIIDGRLALPVDVTWDGATATAATLEVYKDGSPLAAVTRAIYRTMLEHPAFARLERLDIDAVACVEVPSVHLLGDPVPLLAREGLPRGLTRLSLAIPAMVTNAGDLGYWPIPSLRPLHRYLAELAHLDIACCASLGKLALPRLRKLRLWSGVSTRNLRELARSDLPNLEQLELRCDDFAERELRLAAVGSLLRGGALPALRDLELSELDVDEDQHFELDEQGRDPRPWTDMLARSPVVRRLRRLVLNFRDIDREADSLIERAADLAHLEELVLERGQPIRHPTRDAIASALGRA